MPHRFHLLSALFLQWSPCLLVFLWLLGVSTKDAARVVLVSLVAYVATGGKLADHVGIRLGRRALAFVAAIFPLTIIASQLSRVYLGEHGIDFAIFTQAIRSVRDSGVPTTTLVAPTPVDFMSHHFFPFVYILAWASRMSFPPHVIGIVVQGISLGVAIWCFYRVALAVGFQRGDAGWMAGLVCLHPWIRSGGSWGRHDAVFALGLIGIGMLSWVSDRYGVLALTLLSLGAFKETYLIASTIAAGVLIAREFLGERRREPLLLFSATMMITGIGAVFYFIVRPLLPELFESSFNPSARIATLSQWMSLEMIGGKVSYVFLVLGPLLFLPVLSSASRWLLLCVVPFWGASLLSNFPEMYKGINYYGVVPTYVSTFAAMIAVSKWRRVDVVRAPVVMVLMSALALCAGYRASPFGDVRELFVKKTFQPDSLNMIPQTMRVVASEFDSVFVLDKKQVVRHWLAERIPLTWDVILVRTNTLERPSSNLLRGTKICFDDETWQVYCRKGVALQAR